MHTLATPLHLLPKLLAWVKSQWPRQLKPSPEWQRAHDLIVAIDAGGVPLSPRIVNTIARGIGLTVSAQAPMDQTIAHIRQVVGRGR